MFEVGGFRSALHGSVSRRAFLAAGAAPLAVGLAGAAPAHARAKSVIVLWLWGAPSHIDTFDPKPNAPAEVRGPFATIATRTPGVRFTELFPKTAARSDRFALIRSHVNFDGDHLKAGSIGLTGVPEGKDAEAPNFGSVVARHRGRLTTDGTAKFDPVFVKPDELVYTVLESAVQTRLVRLKLGEAAATRLHPDAATSEFEPTFTADGSLYAFVQSRGNLNLKLVIRDAATGKDAVFDPGGGSAGVRRPSFHPRGERVCFGIPTPTGQETAGVGRDGKDRKTLTAGGVNNWPAYSPDGTRIAFGSSRDGEFDLYVMNADGSCVRRVVKLAGMQARPAWSPDGRRLAFTWNRGGHYEIHAVNPDGTGLVRLVGGAERSDYPAWHPDGRSVVFVGERAGKFDLYRVAVT